MGRRTQPTINDVAAEAGVSKSLVSLVMRGEGSVSEEKRRAVLDAAAALGYRPNAAATSLVRGRSLVIGMTLSDLHNPFYADIVDGVDEAATTAGYRTLINTGFRVSEREAVAIDTMLRFRVDGLILAGTLVDRSAVEAAAAAGPVVELTTCSDVAGADSITTDDRAGARLATEHLLELGHRRLGHISGGPGAASEARRAGFVEAAEAAGATVTVVEGGYTEEDGARGIAELFDGNAEPPTAVFAANDFAAIGALSALEERGAHIPDDVSVVGFDNSSLAGLRRIDLTSIDQPRREMGRLAVTRLLDRLSAEATTDRHIVLPPTLVVRGTTAPVGRDRS